MSAANSSQSLDSSFDDGNRSALGERAVAPTSKDAADRLGKPAGQRTPWHAPLRQGAADGTGAIHQFGDLDVEVVSSPDRGACGGRCLRLGAEALARGARVALGLVIEHAALRQIGQGIGKAGVARSLRVPTGRPRGGPLRGPRVR